MKIALTADHRGASLYNNLARLLKEQGHELVAVPTCEANSCDYPDMAYSACKAVAEGEADRAILLCGSGIGMSIAANKVKGIRAALVHDDIGAQTCRSHNDSNVVCLSADMLGQRLIEQIVQIFLATEFEGGRHTRRVEKINAIERGEDPSAITS